MVLILSTVFPSLLQPHIHYHRITTELDDIFGAVLSCMSAVINLSELHKLLDLLVVKGAVLSVVLTDEVLRQ